VPLQPAEIDLDAIGEVDVLVSLISAMAFAASATATNV
jgi:hypothetical protein